MQQYGYSQRWRRRLRANRTGKFRKLSAFADVQIDGIWKHTQKSTQLEVESGLDSITVKSHKNVAKATAKIKAFNFVKEIKLALDQSSQLDDQMHCFSRKRTCWCYADAN